MLNRLLDVFNSFEKHDVKYLIIGGIASVIYGVPRATFDLDILVEASKENANRLLDALSESGFGTASLTNPAGLLSNEITIFQDKVRIDVQTSTPGLIFKEAWERRESINYQGQIVFIVSKKDLIKSKKASARKIDLEDVRLLEMSDDD